MIRLTQDTLSVNPLFFRPSAQGCKDPSSCADYSQGIPLGFMITSIEKMDGLLTGLLRLSRLGRAALCFETLDMRLILEKIVYAMAFQIESAGVLIESGDSIWVESEAGVGSRFIVNLPRTRPEPLIDPQDNASGTVAVMSGKQHENIQDRIQ